jgi:hypothetical protein
MIFCLLALRVTDVNFMICKKQGQDACDLPIRDVDQVLVAAEAVAEI